MPTPPPLRRSAVRPEIACRLNRVRTWLSFRFAMTTAALAVAGFCIALTLAIAVDRYLILSPSARWLIATAVYATPLLLPICLLWQRWRHWSSPVWIARKIESSYPSLAGRLLSSLELAGPVGSANFRRDLLHTQFVDRLQAEVADHIALVDAKAIDADRREKWTVILSMGLVLTLAAIATAPNSTLIQRATRVLLPWADLARITDVHLIIIPPERPWRQLRGESFQVEAVVQRGQPESVAFEIESVTDSPNNRASRPLEILPASNVPGVVSRWAAAFSSSDDRLRIRAVGGGASSDWFQIELIDRPLLQPETLTLVYPEYSAQTSETVDMFTGPITAVVGTTAQLSATGPEALRSPFIEFESPSMPADGEEPGQPIQTALVYRDGHWEGQLLLTTDGRYYLRGTDPETGLLTQPNLWWPVEAVADAPPQVAWSAGVDRSGFHRLADPLRLTAYAADEFSLQDITLEYLAPNRQWQQLPDALQSQHSRDVTTRRDEYQLTATVDPLAIGFADGQLLQLRLVAVDRQGQRSVSDVRQWLIRERFASVDQWRDLTAFGDLVLRVQAFDHSSWKAAVETAVAAQVERPEETAATALEEQVGALNYLISQTASLAHRPSVDPEVVDQLADLGQTLHAFRNAGLYPAQGHGGTPAWPEGAIRKLYGAAVMLAADIQMQAIRHLQSKTALAVTQDVDNETLVARQTAILDMLSDLIARLDELKKPWHSTEQSVLSSRLLEARRLLGEQSFALRETKSLNDERIDNLIAEISQRLQGYRRVYNMIDPFIAQYGDARREISGYDKQLDGWLERVTADRRDESASVAERVAAAEAYAQDATAAMDLLDAIRDVEVWRRPVDRRFIADLGRIKRAIDHGLRSPLEDRQANLARGDRFRQAVATVRTAHQLQQLDEALQRLLAAEVADAATLEADSGFQVRRLAEYEYLIKQLERHIRDARLDVAGPAVGELSWGNLVSVVRKHINDRRWTDQPPVPARNQIQGLLENTRALQETVRVPVEEARTFLDSLAPPIEQLARQAEAAVRRESEAGEKPRSEDANPAAPQEQTADQAAAPKIERLTEALTDLANSQDLLDEQSAQKAALADEAVAAIQAAQSDVRRSNTAEVDEQQSAAEALADTLGRVAERFENPQAAGEPIYQPRVDASEPGQASTDPAPEEPLAQDGAYAEAEFLRQLASLSPERLLNALEAQLPSRPLMQEALAAIEEDTVTAAAATLQSAADEQPRYQQSLEQSDAHLQSIKQSAVDRHSLILRRLQSLTSHDLHWTQMSVDRNRGAASQPLKDLRQDINKLIADGNSLSATQRLTELTTGIGRQQQRVQELQKRLADIREQINQIEQEPVDESRLKGLQREASEWLKNDLRDSRRAAEAEVRNRENAMKAVQRQLDQAKRQVQEAQNKVKKAEQQIAKDPNAADRLTAARQQLTSAQLRQSAAQTGVDERRSLQKAAQEWLDAAGRRNQDLQATDTPHATLAKRLADDAAGLMSDIEQSMAAAAAELRGSAPTDPSVSAARDVANRQNMTASTVTSAAEDLARAARHAHRLEEDAAASQLESATQTARDAAQQHLQPSADSLQQAADGAGEKVTVDAAVAQAAGDHFTAAAQSLAAAAQQATAPAEANPSSTPPASPPSPTASRGSTETSGDPTSEVATQLTQRLSDPQLAQLTDDLDALIHRSPAEGSASEAGESPQDSGQTAGEAGTQSGSSPSQTNGQTSQAASQSAAPSSEVFRSAAEQLAAEMASRRMAAAAGNPSSNQSQSASEADGEGSQSQGTAAGNVDTPEGSSAPLGSDGSLAPVVNEDWAKLKTQKSASLSGDQRAPATGRYGESVDAYFRALSRLRESNGGQ